VDVVQATLIVADSAMKTLKAYWKNILGNTVPLLPTASQKSRSHFVLIYTLQDFIVITLSETMKSQAFAPKNSISS